MEKVDAALVSYMKLLVAENRYERERCALRDIVDSLSPDERVEFLALSTGIEQHIDGYYARRNDAQSTSN